MCCHCAIGEIWPFSIVVCEIAVIRFMVKTVLPVLKADFPSASRLSFFGFRTSLKAHSRRTCMGPEKIGSDCSCVCVRERRRCALPPAPPSRLFIGTATRSCATPPLTSPPPPPPTLRHWCYSLSATHYLPLPGYYRSCCTFATTTTTHVCYHYHYAHYGHWPYHGHYRQCCTTTTTVHAIPPTPLLHPPELLQKKSLNRWTVAKKTVEPSQKTLVAGHRRKKPSLNRCKKPFSVETVAKNQTTVGPRAKKMFFKQLWGWYMVVKDSRWMVGEFFMSYGGIRIRCEKVRLIKKRILGKGHQMTRVLQPQRERGRREREKERGIERNHGEI